MIEFAESSKPASAGMARLLWPAIVVLAAAFFVADHHDWQLSRLPAFESEEVADSPLASKGGLPYRLALVAIAAFGLILLSRRGERPWEFRGSMAVLVVCFLAWCAISWYWSDEPTLTAKRLSVLSICLVCASGIARHFRPRDLCLLAMAVSGIYLAIGLCAELSLGTFRPWSAEHRFAGTIHPNVQSTYCAVICLAAACLAAAGTRRRHWWVLVFVVGLTFLMLTRSRTALAALLVALPALVLLSKSRRSKLLVTVGIPWVICTAALLVSLAGGDAVDRFTDAALMGRREQAQSLTGRVPLWTELLGYAQQQPLHGYGYASFWNKSRVLAISDAMEWHIPHAHSAYIDATLSVGLVGAGMLFLLLVLSILRARTRYQTTGDAGYAFIFALLVYGMVHGLAESSFIQPTLIPCLAACGVLQLAFCLREHVLPEDEGKPFSHRRSEAAGTVDLLTIRERFTTGNRPYHNR